MIHVVKEESRMDNLWFFLEYLRLECLRPRRQGEPTSTSVRGGNKSAKRQFGVS
ncbi:MAG: hypothetical protein PHH43_07720 [Candidatus Cloacimonetes bacterium]|nr:hypothetical protein [Candidatus Cloacimonadota bacterium]MDD3236195.1 hypothetical protein [Candidatus Cloacimonadota bacterium]